MAVFQNIFFDNFYIYVIYKLLKNINYMDIKDGLFKKQRKKKLIGNIQEILR